MAPRRCRLVIAGTPLVWPAASESLGSAVSAGSGSASTTDASWYTAFNALRHSRTENDITPCEE